MKLSGFANQIIRLFLIAGLIALILLSGIYYFHFSQGVLDQEAEKLSISLEWQKQSIGQYYSNLRHIAKTHSQAGETLEMVQAFKTYSEQQIQDGQLVLETNTEEYRELCKDYGQTFEELANQPGIEDIYLVSLPEGRIVYTHQNNPAKGHELNKGKYSNSQLNKACQQALAYEDVRMSAFEHFEAKDQKATAFIAAPVQNGGLAPEGMLVIEISTAGLSQILSHTQGLGQSAKSYLLDSEYKLQNNIAGLSTAAILNREVNSQAAKTAMEGQSGTMESTGPFGEAVLAAYDNIQIDGHSYALIVEKDLREIKAPVHTIRQHLLLAITAMLIILFLLIWAFTRRMASPISKIRERLYQMTQGILPEKGIKYNKANEIGQIAESVNNLITNTRQAANFATQMGKGNLKAEYQALSEKDELGNALLDMRDNLEKAEAELHKRNREEEQRNWTTRGIAKFADILRQNNDNLEELSYNIISNLVKYLEANQGGMFIVNEEEDSGDKQLNLLASYAYGRKKFADKTINWGEGLTGACAQENETIFMTEVPEDYIEITSGLGQDTPRCILIVPLKLNEEVYGVLELASFNVLEQYQVEFVQRVGESIASTINSVKVNMQTARLLQESQEQAEKLTQQEEEMRQNLEEMQTTQEELARKESESRGILNALNTATFTAEYDMDGKVININGAYEKMLEMSREIIIGKHFSDNLKLLGQGDNDEVIDAEKFWNLIKQGETKTITSQLMRNNEAQAIWLQETYAPILNENGQPYKVLKIGFDITDNKLQEVELKKNAAQMKAKEEELRKKDEQQQEEIEELNADNEAKLKELAKKEAESRGILETSMDSVVIFDEDRKIEFFNAAAEKMWGYNTNEVNGENIKILMPRKDTTFSSGLEAIIGVGKEIEVKLKNGEKKPVFLSISETKTEERTVYTAFMRDLSEQKKAEQEINEKIEELKAAEEEMKQTIEELEATQEEMERHDMEMLGIMQSIDNTLIKAEFYKDGKMITANDKFREVLGYEQEDIIGNNISMFIPEEDKKSFDKKWEQVCQGKAQTEIMKRYTKSGEEIWLLSTYTPLKDHHDNIVKILYLANDITEQKEIELKAKKQAEILKKQEEQLKQAQVELERKLEETRNEVKSQFEEIETVKILNEKTLEGMLDAIVTVNNKGVIEFFNKAAEEIWGVKKKDVMGKSIKTMFAAGAEYKDEESFIKEFIVPNIGARNEVNIVKDDGEESAVLLLVSEAIQGKRHTYTAFIQNIEVDLF